MEEGVLLDLAQAETNHKHWIPALTFFLLFGLLWFQKLGIGSSIAKLENIIGNSEILLL